eukprot:m.519463 g.519463  ORF g.519463 m.519463 type:complete len:632 (+) comp21945_c0_seq10:161-2056(+)
MAYLLTRLSKAIDSVKDHAAKLGGPITDGAEELTKLCTAIEELLLYNMKTKTSLLGDVRGYWGYFAECLDQSSAIVQLVHNLTKNKTPIGKGRAFIRCNLNTKTFAEHVQIACRNAKVTSQYYDTNAIMRNSALSSQLIDLLYNLNEIEFKLNDEIGLDDAWPAFKVKTFRDDSNNAPHNLSAESDTRSLISNLSTADTEKSANQLREKIKRLQAEIKALKKERNAAVEEKVEADISWNELVTSLKTQNFKALEESEKARTLLRPTEERREAAEKAEAEARRALEEGKKALQSLLPPALMATAGLHGIRPAQQAREIRGYFETQIDMLETEKQGLRKDVEAIQRELDRMRHSSSMMDQKLAAQNLEHSAMVLTQQKKLAAMEAQYERALSEVSEKHTATVQQLTEQVDVLERQRAEDRKCIAEMSASLHDTERNRADTVDRLKQMEEMVEQATARTEGALHDSNTLRKAVAKCSEEKQSYWQQTQELTELLKAAKSVILSQWQTDDKVERCTCGKAFSFTERKHHCRKCGQIYCASCTARKVPMAASNTPERICTPCFTLTESLASVNYETHNSSHLTPQPTRRNPATEKRGSTRTPQGTSTARAERTSTSSATGTPTTSRDTLRKTSGAK